MKKERKRGYVLRNRRGTFVRGLRGTTRDLQKANLYDTVIDAVMWTDDEDVVRVRIENGKRTIGTVAVEWMG